MLRVWEITYKSYISGKTDIEMVRMVAYHDDYLRLFNKWAENNNWKRVELISANMIGFAEDFTDDV